MGFGKHPLRSLCVLSTLLGTTAYARPQTAARSVCLLDRTTRYPTILSYRDLLDRRGADSNSDDVTRSALAAHLDYLNQQGYRFISLKDWEEALVRGAPSLDKTLILTFDEGFHGIYEHRREMSSRKVPYAIFVSTRWVGDHIRGQKFLSESELRALAADKLVTLGSNSASNPDLKTTGPAVIAREFAESANSLTQWGVKPFAVAYPGGTYDQAVALEAGHFFRWGFTKSLDPMGTTDYDAAISPCYQVPRLNVGADLEPTDRFAKQVERFETQLRRYETLTPRAVPVDLRAPASTGTPALLRSFNKRDL